MKEWNKPELFSLGVKSTFDGDCGCGVIDVMGDIAAMNASKHPCHKTGNGSHNGSGNHGNGVEQNGHVPSTGCTDPTHYKNNIPNCCCFGVTIS